jgi:hypothetical protein
MISALEYHVERLRELLEKFSETAVYISRVYSEDILDMQMDCISGINDEVKHYYAKNLSDIEVENLKTDLTDTDLSNN